jgi:hypothetical protein
VTALGHVFRALDADAVLVVEAPDAQRGARALESFARRFALRAREAVMGFPSGTQQEIALLFDPDRLGARRDPCVDPGVPRFDGIFRVDPGDGRAQPVTWSKPPLEVALRTSSGASLRLIGVHAKSKNAHGARNAAQARRVSLENRHKQIAQCLWLRARVDAHLARGESLVLLGDLNDGPGQDEFEEAFDRSGLEVCWGEGDATRLLEPHARLATAAGPTGAHPSSARFRLPAGPGRGDALAVGPPRLRDDLPGPRGRGPPLAHLAPRSTTRPAGATSGSGTRSCTRRTTFPLLLTLIFRPFNRASASLHGGIMKQTLLSLAVLPPHAALAQESPRAST